MADPDISHSFLDEKCVNILRSPFPAHCKDVSPIALTHRTCPRCKSLLNQFIRHNWIIFWLNYLVETYWLSIDLCSAQRTLFSTFRWSHLIRITIGTTVTHLGRMIKIIAVFFCLSSSHPIIVRGPEARVLLILFLCDWLVSPTSSSFWICGAIAK